MLAICRIDISVAYMYTKNGRIYLEVIARGIRRPDGESSGEVLELCEGVSAWGKGVQVFINGSMMD